MSAPRRHISLKSILVALLFSQLATSGFAQNEAPVRVAVVGLVHGHVQGFLHNLPSHPNVDTLLIAGRWESNDVSRVTKTISWAQSRGMKVVVFGPMLQYDSALPRLLATSIKKNDPSLPFAHRVDQYVGLARQMSRLASDDWHVRYISYFQTLCNADSCVEYVNGDVPLQSDYSHLTKEGSVWLVAKLQQSGELP